MSVAVAESHEGGLTGEHPRLALLREFLQTHYQMAPDEKVDGQGMSRSWTVWAESRGLEPRPATRFYDDLRYFGFMVRRGAGNRTMVFGIAPSARDDLHQLEEAWTDLPTTMSERDAEKGVMVKAGNAIREAIELKRDVIEEVIADVLKIARDSLDDRVRLQAYEMILKRSWATLATRTIEPEPEEEVIEVEVIDRPSLDEVEAAIKKRWGEA